MRKIFPVLMLLLASALARGQQGNTTTLPFNGVPTGSCAFMQFANDITNGNLYFCDQTNNWKQVGAGGGTIGGAGTAGTLPVFNAATTLGDSNVLNSAPLVGNVLRGDGTNFIGSQLSYGDLAGTPSSGQNHSVSGCGVSWAGNLDFTVSACTYVIGGTEYTSALTTITLEAADLVDPRIDAIIVNSAGTATYIKGTAAPSPSLPTVDPTSQIGLSFVYIAANATTPSNFTDTDIYLENTEWTCTASANLNCASVSNPYAGTKDIEATAAVATNNVTLVKPAAGTENLSTYQNLVIFIRSKATWPNAKNLTITWLNGVTQVGSAVILRDGVFGFLSSTTAVYQQITIPTSSWGTGTSLVTTLKVTVAGGGGSIGFYLDNIKLQGGGSSTTNSFMNFRGAWTASAVYSPQDVVTNAGKTYVAILGNTNIATTNTTYWAPFIAGAAGEVLAGATPAFTATPALGTDGSVSGTMTLANGAGGGAHTIIGSAATTTNTILGFTAVPTNGHLVTCTVAGTTCTLTDGGAVPGASAASQGPFYLTNCTPVTADGTVWYGVEALTNWNMAGWRFLKSIATDTKVSCSVTFPHVLPTGTAKIVLANVNSADSTAGHTMTFKTCDIIPSTTMNVGAPTCQSTQNFTTTATAYAPSTLTFGITSTPVVDAQMIVVIDATTASSMASDVMIGELYLEFQ